LLLIYLSFYLPTEVTSGASAISVLLQPLHESHAKLEIRAQGEQEQTA